MRNHFCVGIFVLLLMACSKKLSTSGVLAQKVNLPATSKLASAVFISDSIGIIVGGNYFKNCETYYSTNGGSTWFEGIIDSNKQAGLNKLIFTNNILFAIGWGGACLTSNDSGAHWHYVQVHDYANYLGLCAVPNEQNILLCAQNGKISKHGYLLNEQSANRFNVAITNVFMQSNMVGYASCNTGILKTIDGAQTWQFTNATGDFFKDVVVTNANKIFAIGLNGKIIVSTNAGASWQTLRAQNGINNNIFLNAISKTENNNMLIAVGDNGIVLSINTITNEINSIEKFTKQNLNAICSIKPKTFLLCGDEGTAYKFVVD